ncbi:MAG: hypothetical protein K2X38_22955 [Gemmataceae bacterium]|nr:hypothetical protein [Gemmataceae bacterium]
MVIAIGLFLMAIESSALPTGMLALLGAIAVPTVLVVAHLKADRQRHRELTAMLNVLPIPFALAPAPGFFQQYLKFADALTKIGRHNDRLFRDLALHRLTTVADEFATMATGRIVFHATETWRTAYQHILETLRVKTYLSVAWVRTNDYWNDAPGRQSMQFNYELVGRGIRIERVHILSEELWPFDERLPTGGILEWLVEQRGQGIHVSLLRESDLSKEPDLLRDFAIYGDRATGTQELDEDSRTVRFVLSFDEPSIQKALDRWERLTLYSVPLQNVVDQMQD